LKGSLRWRVIISGTLVAALVKTASISEWSCPVRFSDTVKPAPGLRRSASV
jgi:hypothetical protein